MVACWMVACCGARSLLLQNLLVVEALAVVGHEVGGVADEVECGEMAMCDGERKSVMSSPIRLRTSNTVLNTQA